jgi:nucleotide-binding universal stress UspA family protein
MSVGVTTSMSPTARRLLLTVLAMTATIMQALDTTIANVALPYMQGSLSASLDQINWVLTSYIVAAAIMTAPIGWLSDRFGRKKLFIICVAGFTVASLLCALAQNIEEMVLFRLLQGMAGAALVKEAALAAGVSCDTLHVEHDHPYLAIIETASQKLCDLIVMASHGRRGISAIVLGSETVKVLTHSTIPVLVFRAPHPPFFIGS